MISKILLILSITICTIATSSEVRAQSYRYMDEAGNMHFVDRAEDVPFRYRSQIPSLNPTAVVIDQKKKTKESKLKAREIAKEEKRRERERKLREKQLRKQSKPKVVKVPPAEATKMAEEKILQDEERAKNNENAKPSHDSNGFLAPTAQ